MVFIAALLPLVMMEFLFHCRNTAVEIMKKRWVDWYEKLRE